MNQMDATATPMTACFTAAPDFTPFTALTNNIPLDQMNPSPKKISDSLLRQHAYASAHLPLDEADKCPEGTLNRILWHALKGSQTPYPMPVKPSHSSAGRRCLRAFPRGSAKVPRFPLSRFVENLGSPPGHVLRA
jgi:hypothetical protein